MNISRLCKRDEIVPLFSINPLKYSVRTDSEKHHKSLLQGSYCCCSSDSSVILGVLALKHRHK